jgi:hypothetical protein
LTPSAPFGGEHMTENKDSILGMDKRVENDKDALILLSSVIDHLRDLGHENMASRVVKIMQYIIKKDEKQ